MRRLKQGLGGLCLFLVLALVLIPRLSNAQSIGLESRLSRLESEVFQVRSRLSNLESQISRVDRAAPSLPSPRQQTINPSSEMFDRLATLVIELKERIQNLEAKVSQLEENQQQHDKIGGCKERESK